MKHTFDTREDIWHHVAERRLELADFLETLSEKEWQTPSLREGWTVKDVVSRMTLETHDSSKMWVFWLVWFRFDYEKLFSYVVKQRSVDYTTTQLIKIIRRDSLKPVRPKGIMDMGVLADTIIHEQDIRVPLGKIERIPPAIMQAICDDFAHGGLGLGEAMDGIYSAVADIHLEATDVDWEYGAGDARVYGRSQDLLSALAGRTAVLSRLRGPGVKIMKANLTGIEQPDQHNPEPWFTRQLTPSLQHYLKRVNDVIADYEAGEVELSYAGRRINQNLPNMRLHPMVHKINRLASDIAKDYETQVENERMWSELVSIYQAYESGKWLPTGYMLSVTYGLYEGVTLKHSYSVTIERKHSKTLVESGSAELTAAIKRLIKEINTDQTEEWYLGNIAELLPKTINEFYFVSYNLREYLGEAT